MAIGFVGLLAWSGCDSSPPAGRSDAGARDVVPWIDLAEPDGWTGDGSPGDGSRLADGPADGRPLDGAADGVPADGAGDGPVADAAVVASDVGPDAFPCDPAIGFTSPVPTCSQADPCTNLLASYRLVGITEITSASDAPVCATSQAAINQGRAAFDDGAPVTWTDADGVTRHSCEYRPPGTSSGAKRPLVIFVPGSGGTAAGSYNSTSLRAKAPTFDLSGDVNRPGFILVSSQGRYLHWPTESPEDGTKHDIYHRDLASPSSNRDIAFFDAVIDRLVAEGVVDTSRIYVMGWSNGGRFAALYGIARHATDTPGGSNVAAVAVYSGGDPFENIRLGYLPSCKLATYPTSALPYYLISRSCDALMCNEAHAAAARAAGRVVTPGNIATTWVAALQNEIGAEVTWLRINAQGSPVVLCALTSLCGGTTQLLNHLRWPDGVADGGGVDHEPAMLTFLRDHSLP